MDKQSSKILQHILANSTVVRSTIDDSGNIFIPNSLLEDEPQPVSKVKVQFFFTLVGMAQWAIAHPSTSRYQYISPEEVKANKNLKNAFVIWHHQEHPVMKPEQEKAFEESIKSGLFPAAVIEHTADGHHPIGWSWGSSWYLADFYLCLTYATIQRATMLDLDVKEQFAPIYIAREVQRLNRVVPTLEIVDAMNELQNEPEPNATRPYSVISGPKD